MYTAWRQGQAFDGQAWRASFTRFHATHTGITPHSVCISFAVQYMLWIQVGLGTGCIPNHPGLFPTLLLISSFWDTATHLGSSHLPKILALSFYGVTLQKWLISLGLKCWSLSLGLGLAVNMVWVIVKTNVCSHTATELSAFEHWYSTQCWMVLDIAVVHCHFVYITTWPYSCSQNCIFYCQSECVFCMGKAAGWRMWHIRHFTRWCDISHSEDGSSILSA